MRSVRIPLNSRKYPDKYAIVDEADAPLVQRYCWHVFHTCGNWYANASVGGKTVLMHRLIASPGKHEVVDHINHNGLDNRRVNLRCCSRSVNQQNRRSVQSNNTSGYLGVYLDRRRNKWSAQLRVNGKMRSFGYFADPAQAARARDAAALEHYGPHATLNFPAEQEETN